MPDLFSSNDRRKMRDAFYKALQGLTETQLKAVKDIDGPVMVLAGPGTGKTQVFAARYGYILDETDTNINQILCLTYSEAGVLAMRERLLQFIGPAAHEAHIFTYHSFCNKIINENPEYFFDFKKFKLASPLQRYELIEQILLELPDESRVKRIIGDRYFDIIRFDKQYDNLKKEEKNANQIILQTLEYVDRMAELPDYQYKKNSAQLKTTYYEDKGKFLRTIDVLKTYTSYLEKMKERQWIDYHDMLLEVKSAFIKYPDLLLKYQEQYLYFLIDEFQDTNAIQNNIVLQLISYWDEPNLFVVGDDDQAIYRFQGANEQNLIQIFKKYPGIDVYCITENFRSTQSILDCANDLIEKLPTGRLKDYYLDLPPGTIEKINKKLISSDAAAGSQPPVIRSFINPQHETLAVFNYIREKHRKNENLSDTAILSRRIKTVQDLIYLLELEGIPVSLKLGKDILDQPFIRHFILLLKYLNAEYHELSSGEVYLMPLLYLPYWGLENDDIALIAFLERKNRDRKLLVEKLADRAAWPDAPFKNRELLIQFIEKLKEWQKQLPPVKTLSAIVEEIFRSSGLLTWALKSSESTWNMRCINTLFHQIRSISQHQPHITLSDYLQQLEKMANFEIPINLEAGYTTSNGVHILTAHAAKGQEFESVWIMNAQKADWEGYSGQDQQAYKLPDHITQIEQSKQYKPLDERRLFYVAMTRAKKNLTISWPLVSDSETEKTTAPSDFVQNTVEFLKTTVQPESVDEQLLIDKMILINRKKSIEPEIFNHHLIDEYLTDFVMTASVLNSYLDCPRTFYFEEILRVPQLDNAHIGLGTSLHQALHEFFFQYLKNNGFEIDYLVEFFIQSLKRNEWHFTIDEYNGLIRKFSKQLPLFFEQNKSIWTDVKEYKLEYFIDNVHLNGIPLKGKIDQVISYGSSAVLIDFKSGQGDSSGAKQKLPARSGKSEGGDHWRQSLFYKILLDLDKSTQWNAQKANILFLQADKLDPSKFTNKEYSFTNEDLVYMANLITDVYSKIKNHQFEMGCNKPECDWCDYLKDREIIRTRF